MTPKDEKLAPNMRPFRILEVLSQSVTALTASEIYRSLDLPKQTVHRLCNAMEAEGLLVREPGTRRFRPGRRARNLATGVLSSAHAPIARHQLMAALSNATGETVNLVTPQDKGMIYIDRVETDWPIRVQLPIGSHVPFHCTASGKTFLASQSAQDRVRLIAALPLEPLTDRTITDPAQLQEELEQIARQGYAVDDREFVDAMAAIAVPVIDASGKFYAALAVHGPSQRLPVEKMLEFRTALEQTSERITRLMF